MASCHSLIKLRGELTGNPLDVKIFEAIDWDLTEQFNMGVNPAYGVPTPTLVSPPKVGKSARDKRLLCPQAPNSRRTYLGTCVGAFCTQRIFCGAPARSRHRGAIQPGDSIAQDLPVRLRRPGMNEWVDNFGLRDYNSGILICLNMSELLYSTKYSFRG